MDESTLESELIKRFDVPYADGQALRSAPNEAIAALSADQARKLRCCPINLADNTLSVAMLNPKDALTIRKLERATGYQIAPCIALEYRLDLALRRHYGVSSAHEGQGISLEPSALPKSRPNAAVSSVAGARHAGPCTEAAPEPSYEAVGLDGLPLDAELEPEGFAQQDWRDAAKVLENRISKFAIDQTISDGSGDPSLSRLEAELVAATSKEAIARSILQHCEPLGSRRALFSVTSKNLKVISGLGEGWRGDGATITLNQNQPTVWSMALQSNGFFVGTCAPVNTTEQEFQKLWGSVPDSVILLPIHVRGRLVALLHIDNGHRPIENPPIARLRRACLKAGIAFEMLLLRGKLYDC